MAWCHRVTVVVMREEEANIVTCGRAAAERHDKRHDSWPSGGLDEREEVEEGGVVCQRFLSITRCRLD